jgi:hypothetical protein
MDKPIIVTQFGQNCLRRSVCLLRKAVFDWLAECKDVNDAGPSRRQFLRVVATVAISDIKKALNAGNYICGIRLPPFFHMKIECLFKGPIGCLSNLVHRI